VGEALAALDRDSDVRGVEAGARELGAGCPADRPVDASAVGEGVVRRVDDGVRGHPRDVAGLEGDDRPTEHALDPRLIHGLIVPQAR